MSREQMAAYMRAWRAANPDKERAQRERRKARYDDAARAKRRAYGEARREADRAQKLAYRLNHPDRVRAQMADWSRRNPDKVRINYMARRARVAGASGSHSAAEWAARLEEWGHRCAYCGSTGPLQRDHVIPVTRGGSNDIENLVPACKPCNTSKHNKLLSEWPGRKAVHVGAQAPAA